MRICPECGSAKTYPAATNFICENHHVFPWTDMPLREKIARAISKWPCHVDGFTRDCVYSEEAHERWKATAFAQADEILALIGHESDCATHNEPATPDGPCDCSLSH